MSAHYMAPCCAAALYFPYIILAGILVIARVYGSSNRFSGRNDGVELHFHSVTPKTNSSVMKNGDPSSQVKNKKLTRNIMRIIKTPNTKEKIQLPVHFAHTETHTHTRNTDFTLSKCDFVVFLRHFGR